MPSETHEPAGAIRKMALAEVAGTYTSPEQRAAYRAGMSTAAAICDLVAFVSVGSLLFEASSEGEAEFHGERGDWFWSVGDDWQDEIDYSEYVRAWMPMPEPYRAMLSAAPSAPEDDQP